MISELDEAELQIEKEFRSELEKVKMDLYYEQSAENPDKEFLNELLERRIQITVSLDSLDAIIESKYPRYKDLRSRITDINLMDVQEKLGGNSQLLEFFLGQKNLYAFSITQDTVVLFRSEKAQEVLSKTEQFKESIIQRSEVVEVSKELHRLLVEDHIHPDKEELILVPDNVLNYIPFEILTDSEENHLIDKYAISYSAGVSIFLELSNDFFQYEREDDWAGFAPSYEDDLRLFSNQEEVQSIADQIGGDSFLGEFATRENYLKYNRSYKVLHLATHAEIDNNNPLYNKLIFADGDLTASDIYLSDTRAKMAVLSACNTGFGKLEKGEGVMSMARAFHFSGVPSVVMSLWKVPDGSTKQIMLHFYKYLEEGNSKSVALQKAKLDYLWGTDDPVLRHPYYWAGFVINGNTEALDLKRSIFPILLGASGLLAMLMIVWFISRKTRKRRNSPEKIG
jgi:CHAT domain-containing protein